MLISHLFSSFVTMEAAGGLSVFGSMDGGFGETGALPRPLPETDGSERSELERLTGNLREEKYIKNTTTYKLSCSKMFIIKSVTTATTHMEDIYPNYSRFHFNFVTGGGSQVSSYLYIYLATNSLSPYSDPTLPTFSLIVQFSTIKCNLMESN